MLKSTPRRVDLKRRRSLKRRYAEALTTANNLHLQIDGQRKKSNRAEIELARSRRIAAKRRPVSNEPKFNAKASESSSVIVLLPEQPRT